MSKGELLQAANAAEIVDLIGVAFTCTGSVTMRAAAQGGGTSSIA